jgi:hypothetical protein
MTVKPKASQSADSICCGPWYIYQIPPVLAWVRPMILHVPGSPLPPWFKALTWILAHVGTTTGVSWHKRWLRWICWANGQFTLHSIPGQFIKDHIGEWHKHNPSTSTSSSLMYDIDPVVTLSQTSVATNMVSMSSTNVFTADQHIAALE